MKNKSNDVSGKSKTGTPASIKELLKKATTEMMVLLLLRRKNMYTYEMMSEIECISNGVLTFNTLYQAIYRLKEFNYIEESGKQISDDNRIRIYFAITDDGKKYLLDLISEYQSVIASVDAIISHYQD